VINTNAKTIFETDQFPALLKWDSVEAGNQELTPAKRSQFPFMVKCTFYFPTMDGYVTCSGVLLDNDDVLVAAHCFSYNAHSYVQHFTNFSNNFKHNLCFQVSNCDMRVRRKKFNGVGATS
jgi:hypothetical protein